METKWFNMNERLRSNSIIQRSTSYKLAGERFVDRSVIDGLDRAEWRASYFENQIRARENLPFRAYYGDTRLLDANNKPIATHAVQRLFRTQPVSSGIY